MSHPQSKSPDAPLPADPAARQNYRTRVLQSISEITAPQWDRLLEASDCTQPFLRHRFLALLENSGCVGGESGWQPCHLAIEQEGRIVAVSPLYLKSHSWGEYVFDWAWAEAYQRHGLRYYPKALSAIPFTPVPGPRLPAIDGPAREALAQAMIQFTQAQGLSSLHVLFARDEEAAALQTAGAILRRGVQFHWYNGGWSDFEQFLASLRQDKRKKIRAERRRVTDAGIHHDRLSGRAITEADWRFFYDCYANTYRAHHSTPYLSEQFFLELGEQMPEACLMIIARDGARPIAASLLLQDGERLYGRYWGAIAQVPMLHFETCYYQPIEYAIEHGLRVIEGGAQGEHKMARGFEPVATVSAHWLAEPAFSDAVERFLGREGQAVGAYLDELNERTPFRTSA
jgi:predicted N-acyltransferase